MPFQADGKGAKMPGEGYVIPDDEYALEVVGAKESKSKHGEDQVIVDFKVTDGPHKDFQVKFHYVTFKAPGEKGSGIAVHFCKTIGEPWSVEGTFPVTAANWIGKRLTAFLAAEEYNGKKNMKVKWVKPVESGSQVNESEPEDVESVPF